MWREKKSAVLRAAREGHGTCGVAAGGLPATSKGAITLHRGPRLVLTRLEVDHLDAEGLGTLGGGIGVVGNDTHAEALGAAADLGPDLAEADDGDGLADHRRPDELGPLPLALLHRRIGLQVVTWVVPACVIIQPARYRETCCQRVSDCDVAGLLLDVGA